MRCQVCGGRGFLRAAPLSAPWDSHHRDEVALWAKSVIVPCFACTATGRHG